MDIIDNEKSYEDKDSKPVQEYNIIDEMRKLEQLTKDPNVQTFRKSTFFNQSNKTENNENIEILLKEIVGHLEKIELKLSDIENLLINKSSENFNL